MSLPLCLLFHSQHDQAVCLQMHKGALLYPVQRLTNFSLCCTSLLLPLALKSVVVLEKKPKYNEKGFVYILYKNQDYID